MKRPIQLGFLLLLLLCAGRMFGQNVSSLNHTQTTYTFSLPIQCPSNTPANCNGAGAAANQALLGAGSIFNEVTLNPGKGIKIIRVTDAATDAVNCIHSGAGCNYHAQPSQGGGDVVWDSTATRFVITQSGNQQMPYTFDPNPTSGTYLQFVRLYPAASMGGTGPGLINSSTSAFSKITPKLWYTLMNGSNVPGLSGHTGHYVIMAYDFTSTSTAPTFGSGITLVVDLNTACTALSAVLPGSFDVLSVSDDDQTFGTALGTLNTPNSPSYGVIWNRTLGCATWSAATGIITHFNGTTGTITDLSNGGNPVKFNIHEAQIYHDGGKLYVEGESCYSGQTCNAGGSLPGNNTFIRWTWEDGVPYTGVPSPSGLNTYPIGDNTGCGHNMQGWSVQENRCILDSSSAMQRFQRSPDNSVHGIINPTAPTSSCFVPNSASATVCPNDDQHTSWANNTDGTDTSPFLSITYNQFSSTSSSPVDHVPFLYWDNEIELWSPTCFPSCTSNTAYRLAQTYSDPSVLDNLTFAGAIAVGSISPVPAFGQYFVLYTSNWQYQLGCNDGTYSTSGSGGTCPGSPPQDGGRYDAFIATIPAQGTLSMQGVTLQGVTVH